MYFLFSELPHSVCPLRTRHQVNDCPSGSEKQLNPLCSHEMQHTSPVLISFSYGFVFANRQSFLYNVSVPEVEAEAHFLRSIAPFLSGCTIATAHERCRAGRAAGIC